MLALRFSPRLTSHGMTEDTARAIIRAHEPELVEWATATLAHKLKAKEKVENPAGWLRKAIEEDWRPQPTLFAQEQAQARENERQAEQERLNLEVTTAERRKENAAREKAAIITYINNLRPEEREALEQGFREHLSETVPAIVAKRFIGGSTWSADPLIRAEAAAYIGNAAYPDSSGCPNPLRT